MKTKWIVIWLVLVVSFVFTVMCITAQISGPVKPLSLQVYESLKKTIVTEGVKFSTVTLMPVGGGRNFSGTLVDDGRTQIIITCGHGFAKKHPDSTYEYILDGKRYPIGSVYSHPKSGSFGGRDIAFCFPGKVKKIHHYWNQATNTGWKVMAEKRESFPVIFMTGRKTVFIKGMLWSDDKDPIYVIDHPSKDGFSGSGLVGGGAFFVLTGNLQGGGAAIAEKFGIGEENITFITEL